MQSSRTKAYPLRARWRQGRALVVATLFAGQVGCAGPSAPDGTSESEREEAWLANEVRALPAPTPAPTTAPTTAAAAGFIAGLPSEVQQRAAALVNAPPATPVTQLAAAFTADFEAKLAAGQIAGVPASPAIAGTLPGDVSVSNGGAAGYSIPISVPAGRNGLTPDLAISYSSQASDGFLGHAWSLSMPPVIRKCDPWGNVEVADDPGYSFSDKTVAEAKQRLCYGDLPLVRMSAPLEDDRDRMAPGKYHTVPDSFVEVEIPTVGNSIVVREKSGLTHNYQAYGDWWQRRNTVDRFDNSISYFYSNSGLCAGSSLADVDPDDVAASLYAPCQISYLDKDDPGCLDISGVGACYSRHVRFHYESHPQGRVIYGPGGPMALDRLLTGISVYSDAAPAQGWNYALRYDKGLSTGRTVLKGVKMCSEDGACLPETTFGYADAQGNEASRFRQVASLSLGAADAERIPLVPPPHLNAKLSPVGIWPSRPRVEDVNHDGRDDLLWRHGGSGEQKVALAQPDGTFVERIWTGTPRIGQQGQGMLDPEVDVNGDGLMDIVECVEDGDGIGASELPSGYSGYWSRWLGAESGETAPDRLGVWQVRYGVLGVNDAFGLLSYRTVESRRPCALNAKVLGVYAGNMPSNLDLKYLSWQDPNQRVWTHTQRMHGGQLLVVQHLDPLNESKNPGSVEITNGIDAYSICDVDGAPLNCDEAPYDYWDDEDAEDLPSEVQAWVAPRQRDVNADGRPDLLYRNGIGAEYLAIGAFPEKPLVALNGNGSGKNPYLVVPFTSQRLAIRDEHFDWNEDGFPDVVGVAIPTAAELAAVGDLKNFIPKWQLFKAEFGSPGRLSYEPATTAVDLGPVGGGPFVQPGYPLYAGVPGPKGDLSRILAWGILGGMMPDDPIIEEMHPLGLPGYFGHIQGDFDGDGRRDYGGLYRHAGFNGGGTYFLHINIRQPVQGATPESRPLPDQLIRVVNGLGAETLVDYLPMTDSRVILDNERVFPGQARNSATCLPHPLDPQRCALVRELDGRPLVWRVRRPQDAATGTIREDSYRYGPFYRNTQTNEAVGFAEIEHRVADARTGTAVAYDLRRFSTKGTLDYGSWANIVPRYTVTEVGTVTEAYSFAIERPSGLAPRVYATRTRTQNRTFYLPGDYSLWFAPYFVAPTGKTVAQAVLSASGITGAPALAAAFDASASIVQTWEDIGNDTFDYYGNPLVQNVIGADGVETLTRTAYVREDAAIDQWQVGLPQRVTTTIRAPVVTPSGTTIREQVQTKILRYCETDTCSAAEYATGKVRYEITAPDDPVHEVIRRFDYDAWGNLREEQSKARSGQPGSLYTDELVTTYSYEDGDHLFPTRIENNLGHFTGRTYDWRFGQPSYEVDANGREQAWGYDLLRRNVFHIDRGGMVAAPNVGVWSSFVYTRTQSGSGPSPVALRVNNLDGSWSSTIFDKFGRKRSESYPAFEGHTRTVYTRYDAFGNVAASSLPVDGAPTSSGNEATYLVREVGPSGRLWRETHPNLRTITFDYGFDGAKRWQSVADGGVRKSYAIKSASGRLETNVDGVGNQRCYAYDPTGPLHATWVLRAGIGSGTPLASACTSAGNLFGAVTRMVNDDYGQTTDVYDPEAGHREFRHDALGRTVWERDARGNESRMIYDALGRVTQKITPTGTTAHIWDEQMKGSLSTVTGPWGSVKKLHDNLGRVRSEVIRYTGDTRDAIFGYNYHGYHNKLDSVDVPQAGPAYNDPKFKLNYRYNTVGHLDAVLNTGKTWAYWRALGTDTLGNVTQEAYGIHPTDSGWATSWTTRQYDPWNGALTRLTTYGSENGSFALTQDFIVQRNANGQVWNRVDNLLGQNETYAYDAANRLKRVDVFNGWGATPVNYAYDPLGNLTTKSDAGTLTYATVGTNPRALTRAGDIRYAYDANGNIKERGPTWDKSTYTWDGDNNLSGIVSTAGNLGFTYDSDGTLLTRTGNGTKWSYYGIYSREETSAWASTQTKHHYRVNVGNRTVAEVTFDQDAGNAGADPYTIEHIYPDERNSPNVVALSGGGVEQRMSWDVYGRKRDPNAWWDRNASFENDTNVTVGFTGHRELEDNGLVWMASRHYDPHAGRFMQPDTIVGSPTSTQGWGRYVYVENDPVNYTDPSGHLRDNQMQQGAGWANLNNFATPAEANFLGEQNALAFSGFESAQELVARLNAKQGMLTTSQLEAIWLGHMVGKVDPAQGSGAQTADSTRPVVATARSGSRNPIGAYSQQGSSVAPLAQGGGPAVLNEKRVLRGETANGAPLWRTELTLTAAAKAKLDPIFRQLKFDIAKVKFTFAYTGDGSAYTLGNRVALNESYWKDPKVTGLDQIKLLAHEMTHSVQYQMYGGGAQGASKFLYRYTSQWPRDYTVPAQLQSIPLSQLALLDGRFKLDQIAERVSMEVTSWP